MDVLIVHQWPEFWAMGENAGASSFFETAHAYVTHGHRVRVVLPSFGSNSTPPSYHEMALHPVVFKEDPMLLRPGLRGLLDRIRRYNSFRRRMRDGALAACRNDRPDVVVALGPHSAAVGRDVARSLGVPNVTRLFGQALSLHINERGAIASPRFFGNFPEIIAFRARCDALIVHDDGSRGDRVARLLGASQRLKFWRDGIDLELVDRKLPRAQARNELGYGADEVIVASVGRMTREKNLARALRAFAGARESHPELRFLIVGDGPEQKNLEALCMTLGLSDHVRFHGVMSRDRIHPVFSAMDMLVSTSNRTNMTNSTLEAMAFGVPVVALDAGDTGSVVRDGETGLLVGAEDPGALRAAIEKLAGDPELRRQLGGAASEFVRGNFETVPERVAREVKLVEHIVGNTSVAGRKSGDK